MLTVKPNKKLMRIKNRRKNCNKNLQLIVNYVSAVVNIIISNAHFCIFTGSKTFLPPIFRTDYLVLVIFEGRNSENM